MSSSTGSPRRSVVWDAVLSFALVATTALASIVIVALAGLALARFGALELGTAGRTVFGMVVCVVGSACAASLLGRWPSGQVHSRAGLALSAILGCGGAWLAGMGLGPWPDLLSDEVIQGGQLIFLVEVVKTFVPWLAGALVAFVILRYDAGRAGTLREE